MRTQRDLEEREVIEFGEPKAGWMHVKIGEHGFWGSYLTDVWDDLDYALNLESPEDVRRIFLDGETDGFLYLTTFLSADGEILYIVYEPEFTGHDEPELMKFSYKEFLKEYEEQKEKIGRDNYIVNFLNE